jgi:hypothetical protein
MLTYKNYNTNLNNLKNQLDEVGIAVIPNILSSSEIDDSINQMWKMLADLTQNFELPISKNNMETWKSFYDLCPLEDMLLQYWKVGHSDLAWNLRQNSKLLEVFKCLWNVEENELLTSFDSISIHFPPEITKIGKFQENKSNWYHFDQSSEKKGLHCIQGFVNLYDVSSGDTSLSVYEGSHKYHESFFDFYQKKIDKDWYQLKNEEIHFFKDLNEYGVLVEAGSLVLWDSRLLHQGVLCSKHRPNPNIRAVVYICMIPRYKSNNKQLEKKKQAFRDERMTTHWPHEIKRVGQYPTNKEKKNTCWNLVMPVKMAKLKPIGYKLAGF